MSWPPHTRIRVLHVGKFYPPVPGGMENHLEQLCCGLRDWTDVQVLVANTSAHRVREVIRGIPVTRVPTVAMVAGTPICPDLTVEIARAEVDLVHLHLPNPMAVLAFLLSGQKAKLVLSHHSDIVRQKLLRLPLMPMHYWIRRLAPAITVATPRYLETSAELTAVRERCHAIPYGIPKLVPTEAQLAAAAQLRATYGAPLVLAVGRLVYYKGFEYLIRAMAGVPAQLLIVGAGPLRPALQRACEDSGVADRVHLLGAVDDVLPYYQAAEVFVLPSIARTEGFGIVQLEAMACGKPVVNTSLDTGVPFVSLHGVTGITVPPADSKALADALNLLLGSPELRARFGLAGRKRVETEFSLDSMVNRTLAVYEQVLGWSCGRDGVYSPAEKPVAQPYLPHPVGSLLKS